MELESLRLKLSSLKSDEAKLKRVIEDKTKEGEVLENSKSSLFKTYQAQLAQLKATFAAQQETHARAETSLAGKLDQLQRASCKLEEEMKSIGEQIEKWSQTSFLEGMDEDLQLLLKPKPTTEVVVIDEDDDEEGTFHSLYDILLTLE
jgi:predicted  nucleic acid-binding Zn-ribbon protein